MQFNIKISSYTKEFEICKYVSSLALRVLAMFVITYVAISFFSGAALAAGSRFQTNWRAIDGKTGSATCNNSGKICVESGIKEMDGIRTSKPCWRYTYSKTCQFPSKNDCHLINHCYEVGLKECLLHDSLGNCINQKKEFSCKRREVGFRDHEKLKQKPTGDEAKRIVCKGIPCIDGNCIDKSYNEDQDMMKSVSQLYAASKTAGAKDLNFKLFEGFSQHCTKKPTGYMSCCKVSGWGEVLGANCNVDERKLLDLQKKNLCVYVGKKTTGTSPFHVNKHYSCCFGNMLNKVFQVEGRKQLGINFGSGGSPDCRGLTLAEILKLDFEKMDFSEFVAEIKGRMKVPNIGDIKTRTKSSIPTMKEFKDTGATSHLDPDNKRGGISDKMLAPMADEGAYAK